MVKLLKDSEITVDLHEFHKLSGKVFDLALSDAKRDVHQENIINSLNKINETLSVVTVDVSSMKTELNFRWKLLIYVLGFLGASHAPNVYTTVKNMISSFGAS